MAVNPTVRLIATLSNLIRRKIDSAEGVGGLTPAQNGILHFILGRCREQDLFQKDIEEEFNLRRPTATEILKLMERKGLILREPLPQNKRAKKITLTPKGLAICQENHRRIMEIENKLLTGFEQEEIRQLLEFLSRMQQNME